MATIYQKNGQSVYDSNGITYDAKTGQQLGGTSSSAMPGSVASFTQPLTSQNTANTPVINLTPKPDNTNYAGILAGAQQQALSLQQQIQTQAPKPQEAPQTQTQTPSIMDYIKSIEAPQSQVASFQDAYSQSGLKDQQNVVNQKAQVTQQAQGRLNNISAQLQALNAEATAIPIQLQQDSEGRGRTAGGIAPILTDQLRANALKAIPLQAQAYVAQAEVATAQGDQQLAQDLYSQASERFDKVFQLQMQDVQNQYEYKTGIIDKLFTFADKQEQRQLEAIKTKQAQDFQTSKNTIAFNREKELATIKNKGIVPTGGGISPTTQSIIDNPSLFDDLTPTVRGQVIAELQAGGYETTNLGVKGLSDGAIQSISQTQKALSDLTDLKAKIEGKTDMLGPITGLAALNPYSQARQLQADVDRVRQTVGKALEGGVLRKEDEEKYKKILATLTDTPETAVYKIDALLSSIQRDIENYKSLQQSSGRSIDVGASLQKKGAVTPVTDLRTKYNY